MPATIVVKEEAYQDLAKIASKIYENNPRVSARFVACVNQTYEWLSRVPFGGAVLDELVATHPNMRYARVKRFKNYIIFYEASETEIVIHHVVDGRRDYMSDIFDL